MRVRIFIASVILICTNPANFVYLKDSRCPTVFNLGTTTYPSIRGKFEEKGGSLESCESNSVPTSIATSMASSEETQIPERILAENNAIQFQTMTFKRASDCAQREPRESGKRIRILYPLHEAFEDDKLVSDEQEKNSFMSSEKQTISKGLIQNTRRNFEMIMNYLDSATRETSSELTPETKAALQLTTQLLQQRYNEETKEVELGPVFARKKSLREEKNEFICRKCADEKNNKPYD